jgi:restriction endonuclease S subunit
MNKVKLADIAEVISGLSYRRYKDESEDSYDVIVQRSIRKDGILKDFEKVRLVKPKSRYFTKSGDILMKMPYPYDVVCVGHENLVVSDRIAIIRVNKNFNPSFIAHLLSNAHVKKQLHEIGTTERMPHTSIKDIKEIRLNLPDLGKQKKHGELLNTINEKITKDMQVVEYDRRLKEGILNKLWEEG